MQTQVNNLVLNDLGDVDLTITPTINQILKYNGTNFVAANESSGSNTLATLTDVDLGVLNNGDILSYDLPNTKWVNSGLNFTPAVLEYLQFKSITGTCLIDPNTTGEWGISSAIGFFGLPSSGTADFDQTRSSGIITIINNKWIQFLKSGRYWIQFNAYSNNSNNQIYFHIGATNPPPKVAISTASPASTASTVSLDNIFNVTAGDFLVCGQAVPNAAWTYPSWIIEYLNESNSIIHQTTNTGSVTFNQLPLVIDYLRIYNTPGNAIAMNNANTTKNGLSGVLAYLIQSVNGYVQDFSNSTFFTRIDDHVGFFTKGGKYWFDWDANI